MENIEIARIFDEVADLLEIENANPFRVRAYRNAARTVQTRSVPLSAVLSREGEDALQELPGIGKDLAGKIREIIETGELTLLNELREKTPPGVADLMHLPGLGPKRARQIYHELGIENLDELEKAVREERLREIHGLGPKLEQKILQGIAEQRARAGRFRLAEADAYIRPFLEHLRGAPGIQALEVAGSYRRRRETVGDVDLLVTAKAAAPIADRFVSYPEVAEVLAHGETKCAVRLKSRLQVDLRIVPQASFGAALHYFTGSKAHNIAVRKLGVRNKLKINEYGVFRNSKRVGGATEAEVFEAVGLPWIPPELREDRGEIDAAAEGRLPRLVELGDIRGDLQMHTKYTDGKNTLKEMAQACHDRGYDYFAVTDHSKAVRVAGGLEPKDFRKQFREIERVQKEVEGITILKGAEVDILGEGALDLDDEFLAELDVVVVSVHSKFNLSQAEMTKRIVRALRNPNVHILGHPTGRILGRREPYPLDLEEVVRVALDHHVALEVNAQPDRLDLSDLHTQMAKEAGVKLVISTDAHRIEELDHMRYGVDQARRGWCEASDILNTLPTARFLEAIRKK